MSSSLSDDILEAALARIGGTVRVGQSQMVRAVTRALDQRRHLLVQAGTGTGKSLGYLAPALAYLTEHPQERIVIATATLALQAQLASRDIPAAMAALADVTGATLRWVVVKGRSNYACLYRVRREVAPDQDALFSGYSLPVEVQAVDADPMSALGSEVVALREWAEAAAVTGNLADRDEAPPHSGQSWSQVSVSGRECLGAQSCPFGNECFVEKVHAAARLSPLIVTNHALLAIDAMSDVAALPAYDAVVIDEGHELVARVTSAASAELSSQAMERVTRRCLHWLEEDTGTDLLNAVDGCVTALHSAAVARVTDPNSDFAAACRRLRDANRQALSDLIAADEDAERQQVQAALTELYEIADGMAALSDSNVIWISEHERYGRKAHLSPLSVSGLIRDRIFARVPVIMTSATLKLGGDFTSVSAAVGLTAADKLDADTLDEIRDDAPEPNPHSWSALDVGSPFDYSRQGILYIAGHLSSPHRGGIAEDAMAELAELVWAAGGHALCLFASQRSATAAAEFCRAQLPQQTILCQGDTQLSELTRRFIAEPGTSLFGTMSLWQGIDAPGDTCQLVVIDKIPFPRPDDPLMAARQQAVQDAGRNGFMAIAASHAALLLAQGSGRLIRQVSDRGVVAVLDPRLITARYGPFLRSSMPPFWMTTSREVAVQALRRLQENRTTGARCESQQ